MFEVRLGVSLGSESPSERPGIASEGLDTITPGDFAGNRPSWRRSVGRVAPRRRLTGGTPTGGERIGQRRWLRAT
jgi:hypothetical protein